MPRSPDFFTQLSRDELDALEAYAREPGRTVDGCHEWLLGHGFTASRSAVGVWKKRFDAEDRIAQASRLAGNIMATAKAEGAAGIGEAATHTLSQLLFEQLLRLQTSADVDSGELMKLSISLGNAMKTQNVVNELKRQGREQMEQLATAARQKQITPEMIQSVSKAVFG
jgi:hypothetical protein